MSVDKVEKVPQDISYEPRAHYVERNGSWIKASALIMTTTTLPTLLALPSALAALGWAAGIIIILLSCLGAFYCFLRLVTMNNYGGKRWLTYPELAAAISGKKGFGYTVQTLQYLVQWGVGIANTILAAQLMGVMYATRCADCDPISQTNWTLICGGVLVLLGLLPDFTERNLAIIISGSFTLIYCTCAIILSFMNNKHSTADYGYTGSTSHQVFYAFNGIGIIWFCYGDTCYPELQSMLKPDEKDSTVKSMKKGMYLAFATTIPLLLMVAVVGYWAFGNQVADLLLDPEMTPQPLLGIVAVLSIIQLIFSVIMFAQPIYNWTETKLMQRFPKATWLQKEIQKTTGEEVGGAKQRIIVPSWLLMILNRFFYAGSITLFSVFFPFFGSIMSLIGAVGLTPLTYVFPIYLWVVYKEKESTMTKGNRWFHIVFASIYLVGGSLATVGAIENIVVSFDTFTLG